jgi:hypothetical protein
MKTAELTGALLDYWVGRAEEVGVTPPPVVECLNDKARGWKAYSPSTDWAQGGPLIDKYEIDIEKMYTDWLACLLNKTGATIVAEGDTPLQAICRAVVRAAFGDEVEEVAV